MTRTRSMTMVWVCTYLAFSVSSRCAAGDSPVARWEFQEHLPKSFPRRYDKRSSLDDDLMPSSVLSSSSSSSVWCQANLPDDEFSTILKRPFRNLAFVRGGSQPTNNRSSNNNQNGHENGAVDAGVTAGERSTKVTDGSTDDQAVGVKAHLKSNAVGDPDGEGSDSDGDDDDDSFDDSDWEHFEEQQLPVTEELIVDPAQLRVELELVEDKSANNKDAETKSPAAVVEEDDETEPTRGGGVGLRFGQRLKRPSNQKQQQNQKSRWLQKEQYQQQQEQLLDAWQEYVYAPLPALDTAAARLLDSASKIRLDRRTLYAVLLQEWQKSGTTSERKMLSIETSQALQAALSLATQPIWRQTLQRPNAIRLYSSAEEADRGSTLAMQETTAMALANSLGAGMVILDDQILSSVRQKLLRSGYPEEAAKPATLLQSLLALAKEGNLRVRANASISKCMERDLQLGLDDPFDERATSSCQEMANWEQKRATSLAEAKPMPLVIFLRIKSCNLLLKSKSAIEVLLQECTSNESTNLIVLGKGLDASTASLPKDLVSPAQHHSPEGYQTSDGELPMRSTPGAAPWFGFSPHNQNASGQNDPEGSRRFNIFLARTTDPATGAPGILGAIAPPQAGNLFPHMMALQARDRIMDDDDSPIKAELERWAQMLQQQMQTHGGMPLPPPQFFNASLPGATPPPPPHVIQETLQQALSELLDRLAAAEAGEDGSDDNSHDTDEPIDSASKLSPDLHKAFAQVLRNENLRRGIAENLARAAPALSDPKCQGVMLSVYVPPPPTANLNRLDGNNNNNNSGNTNKLPTMSGWFEKIMNHQNEAKKQQQTRTRTMAAAAAVMAASNSPQSKASSEEKTARHLQKLEEISRPIVVDVPTDPVRAKSWNAWIQRERGSVMFRQNRRKLQAQLRHHQLGLQQHTGTFGAGSSLRQMLSVRPIEDEAMERVVQCAMELEAAKSQRMLESPEETELRESSREVDITLSQLLSSTPDGNAAGVSTAPTSKSLHPSTLETALTMICRISPSPAGGMFLGSGSATGAHRSREEISALAQDKHERALVSQVVSPQDIGVTYDMIGGLSEVKELLRQSITYPLKYPHLYSEGIAREAVKGVLLFGPPGTGKTMLAKAVATEGGASFLSVDASSVENKWLGESEKNAKAVFTLARRLAPCVIFIDEVDSLLSSREGSSDDSAHGTLTSVKTTMMSEWDGLNSGTNGSGEAGSDRVVVIGSTNRPFDLDEAVLRRFPRRILVDLPDLDTRREILEVTLAENRMDPSVNLTKIAERLEGYTGSDIKEVCREAVVQISHEQAKLLDQGGVNPRADITQGSLQRLRPVTVEDFDKALSKLKRSVSEKGRELARVWEWNDEYGEVKKEKKNHLPHLANMYL